MSALDLYTVGQWTVCKLTVEGGTIVHILGSLRPVQGCCKARQ